MPRSGGYWLCPALIAATAASSTSVGPSVSGKPCPRLIAPVSAASIDISAKIDRRWPCIRATRCGLGGTIMVDASGRSAPAGKATGLR